MNRNARWLGVIAGLAIAGGCLFVAGAAEPAPVIRVGYYENPPKVYRDASGRPAGIFPEFLNHVAQLCGWRLDWQFGVWTDCLQRLEAGELDLMVDVAPSASRAQRFRFGQEAMLINWGVVYAAEEAPICCILELGDKRVAVMRGSINYDDEGGIQDLLEKFDLTVKFVEADDYDGVFRLLAEGRADYGVVNRIYGAQNAGRYKLRATPILFSPHRLLFAAPLNQPAGEARLTAIDEVIRRERTDSSSVYQATLAKYFEGLIRPPEKGLPAWALWAAWGAGGSLLVLLITAGGLWCKRREDCTRLRLMTDEYERYFSSSLDLLCIADTSGRFHKLNPEWERTLGYPLAELVGREFLELVHPDDLEATRAALGRLGAQEQVLNFVNRYRTRDGEYRWLEWHSFPIGGRVYAVARDITERKRIEDELQSEKIRLQSIFRVAPVGIGLVVERVMRDVNEQVCLMVGRSREELIGQSSRILYPDQAEFERVGREKYQQIARLGRGTLETRWVRADGRVIDVLLSSTPLDPADLTRGVTFTALDITERQQAAAALQESAENLRITLDSIGDAVITTDAQGRVERLNPVACQLTGWEAEAARGRPLGEVFRLVSGQTREPVEDPVARIMAAGQVVGLVGQTLLLARDGGERQIADSGAPIRDAQGRVQGVVLVFRDVTEQLRLEAQLRQAQKMEAIGQLAGGVAHDFNNMLGGILGAAELLALKLGEDHPLRKYVNLITDAGETAASLIGKLLAFSRQAKVRSAPVDLHQTINDAVHILERSIDRRITIHADLSADPAVIMGDGAQLENVFINLGLNARDAMPDGGEIHISTRRVELDAGFILSGEDPIPAGTYLEAIVADTGVGMEPYVLARVFEPFFTTKGVGRGTGLGLPAIYGTVREHQGCIRVYSEPGRGSVFKVYLPAAPEPAIPATAAEGREAATCLNRTILLVDDEAVLRTVGASLLEAAGCRVLLAEDGRVGIEVFKAHAGEIDLVLLDLVMPNLGGRETFIELKRLNPGVKVIFASGFAKDAGVSELLTDPAAVGFIQKPYRRAELYKLLASVFGLSV